MAGSNIKGQMLRYALSGGVLTLLYASVYWTIAVPFGTPALVANSVAFVVNLAAGWLIHSRWSFRGQTVRNMRHVAFSRFFLINVAGYALNSFWVWLIVEQMDGSVALPVVPIALITPWFSFWLNRRLIFADQAP